MFFRRDPIALARARAGRSFSEFFVDFFADVAAPGWRARARDEKRK
jgi:hypothetical protein